MVDSSQEIFCVDVRARQVSMPMESFQKIVRRVWKSKKGSKVSLGRDLSYIDLTNESMELLGIYVHSFLRSYGIMWDGVELHVCSIIKNVTKEMLECHLGFRKKMSKKSLENVPLQIYGYCKDSQILFVEAITDSAVSWADSIIKGGKLNVWGEETRGCKCLTSNKTRICTQCSESRSSNIESLRRKVVGGKVILRTMLAFLMVYKPRKKFHPNFLPSIYITLKGEVRVLSLVELVDEVKVPGSDNLTEVISFLYGITVGLGGKCVESIGGLQYTDKLPKSPHIPLPLRNYYEFLGTYDPADPYPPDHFFDPPFVHPWSDCAMYGFNMFYLIDCYDKNIGDGMSSHFPKDGWLDYVVNNKITEWFKEWSQPSKQQNLSETYYNLFKHIYDRHTIFKAGLKRSRSAINAGQRKRPKSPKDLVCMVDSTMDISGVLSQAENKYLRSDSSKENMFMENVRTWNLLGFESS